MFSLYFQRSMEEITRILNNTFVASKNMKRINPNLLFIS